MVPHAGFLAFVCGILYEVLIDCAILGIEFFLKSWKSGKNECFFLGKVAKIFVFFLGKAAKNDYVCPGKAAKMNL